MMILTKDEERDFLDVINQERAVRDLLCYNCDKSPIATSVSMFYSEKDKTYNIELSYNGYPKKR